MLDGQHWLRDRASTTTDINDSADSCRTKDFFDSSCRGTLERASAVIRAFPGTCVILKLYLIMQDVLW